MSWLGDLINPSKPQSKGALVEQAAAKWIEKSGMVIKAQNFRCKLGEIDIIAQTGDTLVFVEVRYRKNAVYGSGAESVTLQKQRKIIRAAHIYLQQFSDKMQPACRFDVIDVSGEPWRFNWIENAFEVSEWI